MCSPGWDENTRMEPAWDSQVESALPNTWFRRQKWRASLFFKFFLFSYSTSFPEWQSQKTLLHPTQLLGHSDWHGQKLRQSFNFAPHSIRHWPFCHEPQSSWHSFDSSEQYWRHSSAKLSFLFENSNDVCFYWQNITYWHSLKVVANVKGRSNDILIVNRLLTKV